VVVGILFRAVRSCRASLSGSSSKVLAATAGDEEGGDVEGDVEGGDVEGEGVPRSAETNAVLISPPPEACAAA
jgi:hypothetical protein